MNKSNSDWQPSYPFNESSVRAAVVRELYASQRGLCVYCGRQLDLEWPGKSFHIEHFRPQSKFRHLDVDFGNLYLSCGQEDEFGSISQTCGTKKDEWFDQCQVVEPIYPDCMSFFSFGLNGEVAVVGGSTAASMMIEVLNLNHKELAKDREDLLLLIDGGTLTADDLFDTSTGIAEGYAHVAFKHVGRFIP